MRASETRRPSVACSRTSGMSAPIRCAAAPSSTGTGRPAGSWDGSVCVATWLLSLPLSGHIEIEDRALTTNVVDLSAEQTVRDDGAAPRHQAQVGVRYPAHEPSRVLRVDPQLGRSLEGGLRKQEPRMPLK